MSKSKGFYHLTEARELRGLSVTELANRIGVSRQAIYKYESGQQIPSAEVQQAIILQLKLPYTFFEYKRQGIDLKGKPVFFRDMKSNLESKRRMAFQWLQLLCLHVKYLQEYLILNQVNLPILDVPNVLDLEDEEIDLAAGRLRRFWELQNGPISNLTQLLENNGFIILRKFFEADKMDACSIVENGRPYLLINTYKQTCSRDLMNMAHELGHVILHQGITLEDLEDKETFDLIEHQAWRFAQAFLLPPSVFIPEIGYPTLSRFKILKQRWRISMAAMILYCRDFGIIDSARCQYFYREMARQGIRTREPYDDELKTEESTVLLECEQILAAEGIISHKEMLKDSCLGEKEYCELINAPHDYFYSSHNKPKVRNNIESNTDPKVDTCDLSAGSINITKIAGNEKNQKKMKIRIIARKKIYNMSTGKLMADKELHYLDGIKFGPVKEYKTNRITHEIAEDLIKEFEKKYPDFDSAVYTIEEVQTN